MTLVAWQATVQDDEGNIIVNPSLTVRNVSDGDLADIFDADGDPLVNPFIGTTEGFVQFFAAPGSYTVQGVRGGSVTQTWTVVLKSASLEFDSVADLLADDAIAYTGSPIYRVSSGDTIVTRGEGFAYTVAASDASDHHVTTAGGVKLYVLPTATGQYLAQAFGTSIAKAFDVAARAKRPLMLTGGYTVTAPLLNIFSGDAELHLACVGDVTITVDPAAAYIRDLIICQTTSVSSHSITGGSLTVVGNAKIGSGITVSHTAASDGGVVNFTCPVTVRGCTKEAANTYENSGIAVFGRFVKVTMNNPTVEDVTRLSSAGACAGISVSGFVGDVEIRSPVTKRVFAGAGTGDADGIKCFGFARNGLGYKRDGRVRIYGAYFEDCQGRSYKSQCSDDVLYSPVVKRSAVVAVSITQGVDFDFQTGNGRLIDPRVEYYADGATSPLGASYSVVAFQQLLQDEEMHSRLENLTVISDVAIPRLVLSVHAASTARSVAEVDGVNLIPANGFATTMLSRAVMEFSAAQVVAKTERTHLAVRGVNGPNTWALIGYTDYDGVAALTSKLSWDVTDCNSTLSPASASARAFTNISGSAILAVEQFRMFNLNNYRTLYTGATAINFGTLAVGTVITVDIAAVAATNPPPWGASGYAHIRCEGQWFGATDRMIWVVKDGGTNVWFTQNGGASWGVVK